VVWDAKRAGICKFMSHVGHTLCCMPKDGSGGNKQNDIPKRQATKTIYSKVHYREGRSSSITLLEVAGGGMNIEVEFVIWVSAEGLSIRRRCEGGPKLFSSTGAACFRPRLCAKRPSKRGSSFRHGSYITVQSCRAGLYYVT
jgi:hypothetical protein